MGHKVKAIYENGVIKPLETLTGISNQQLIDITIEDATQQGEVVQLGGSLRDHPLNDFDQSLKEFRQTSWHHLATEMNNE